MTEKNKIEQSTVDVFNKTNKQQKNRIEQSRIETKSMNGWMDGIDVCYNRIEQKGRKNRIQ